MSTSSYRINGLSKDDREDTRDYRRYSSRNHDERNEQEEQVMNIINENHHQISKDVRCHIERIISIGATCIAEISGRFFLLVEIEIDVAGEELEQVIIFKISAAQAEALLRAGIRRCTIVTTIPTPRPGQEINLICVFVVGNFAFLVFDVENNTDELVLVRVPLCTII